MLTQCLTHFLIDCNSGLSTYSHIFYFGISRQYCELCGFLFTLEGCLFEQVSQITVLTSKLDYTAHYRTSFFPSFVTTSSIPIVFWKVWYFTFLSQSHTQVLEFQIYDIFCKMYQKIKTAFYLQKWTKLVLKQE